MQCTTCIFANLVILLFLVKIGQSNEIKLLSRVTRVINGDFVGNGEAPHQVALLRDGEFFCGGSLIQKQTVLTAGHCIFDCKTNEKYDESRLQVRYNTLEHKNGPTLKVKKAIVHPSYSNSSEDHDIAVLHLEGPIQGGTNAKVIDLIPNSKRPANGSTVYVTGWGHCKLFIPEASEKLRSASLTLYSQEECKKVWQSDFENNLMICAASTTQSFCDGDSGGPLTYQGWLVGVVSFGEQYCRPSSRKLNAPNVFIDVAYFRDWIRNNMHPTESWFVRFYKSIKNLF